MTFIASNFERFKDKIVVWERNSNGKRVIREYKSPQYFYIPAPDGEFEAITGEKLTKLEFGSKTEFDEACLSYPKRFESDITPLEKVMMDNYADKSAPTLNIGLLDIEVDYDPLVPGGASKLVEDPYAPINAITIWLSEVDTYFCFAVPPPGFNAEKYSVSLEQSNQTFYLCRDERELLDQFFAVLDDVDIISGWNSEFFDLPYIGRRVELLYGETGLRRLGFDRGPMPRWTEKERFKHAKEKDLCLEIGSRVHLDYMRLFKKFNLNSRQSYSLAAIASEELSTPKLHHDETLHQLYRGNYRPDLTRLKPESEWADYEKANIEREFLRQEIERRGLNIPK